MEVGDLTIEVLKGIREDIQNLGKTLGERIDDTNARLEETNARLEETNARLDRVVEGQIRMATQLNERLGRVEVEIHGLNHRLDNFLIGPMGQSVRDHEERIGRLEKQLGM